jgi:NAD(P)-dependent dehydrogenase (short-subunit alcohol dehydrogenase family)
MADAPARSPFSLADKVVLQFGGSGLLGRALIRSLAAADATLVIASRDAKALASKTDALGASRDRIHFENVDLLDEDSIRACVNQIVARLGRLDGMVYNAVSRPMTGGFNDSLAHWEESMRLNATGFFAAVRVCGDAMARARHGSIVNIASHMGMVGMHPALYDGPAAQPAPDYFFHKAGMINATRYLASHYGGSGVRVNVVSPGGIYNPERPQKPEFLQRYAPMTMLGRMADSAEIGGAVVFLLSDASTYVTGANLPVDGGYSAK